MVIQPRTIYSLPKADIQIGLDGCDYLPIVLDKDTGEYQKGDILGSFIYITNKTSGKEPGFIGYLRNDAYRKAIVQIINNNKHSPAFSKHIRPTLANGDLQIYLLKPENQHILNKFETDPKVMQYMMEELSEKGSLPQYMVKGLFKTPQWFNKVAVPLERYKSTPGNQKLPEPLRTIRAGLQRLWTRKPREQVSLEFFLETLSTDIARASGMKAQIQSVCNQRYTDDFMGHPTVVKLESGYQDLESRGVGGYFVKGEYERDPKTQKIKKDNDGFKIFKPKTDPTGYYHSDNSIKGLGENLALMWIQSDYDALGGKAQNKALIGNELFGTDFGHTYPNSNFVIPTLQDNGTFNNNNMNAKIKNIDAFYDVPLSEMIAGVKKHAVTNREAVNETFKKYHQRAQQLEEEDPVAHKRLANAVLENWTKDLKARQKLAEIFKNRLDLPPEQIDLINNLEKLCSKVVTNVSPNNPRVKLNHLRVTEGRVVFQLEPPKDKQSDHVLTFEASNSREATEILRKLKVFDPTIPGLDSKLLEIETNHKNGKHKIKIHRNEKQLQNMIEAFNEDDIALHRGIPTISAEARLAKQCQALFNSEKPIHCQVVRKDAEPKSFFRKFLSLFSSPEPEQYKIIIKSVDNFQVQKKNKAFKIIKMFGVKINFDSKDNAITITGNAVELQATLNYIKQQSSQSVIAPRSIVLNHDELNEQLHKETYTVHRHYSSEQPNHAEFTPQYNLGCSKNNTISNSPAEHNKDQLPVQNEPKPLEHTNPKA